MNKQDKTLEKIKDNTCGTCYELFSANIAIYTRNTLKLLYVEDDLEFYLPDGTYINIGTENDIVGKVGTTKDAQHLLFTHPDNIYELMKKNPDESEVLKFLERFSDKTTILKLKSNLSIALKLVNFRKSEVKEKWYPDYDIEFRLYHNNDILFRHNLGNSYKEFNKNCKTLEYALNMYFLNSRKV